MIHDNCHLQLPDPFCILATRSILGICVVFVYASSSSSLMIRGRSTRLSRHGRLMWSLGTMWSGTSSRMYLWVEEQISSESLQNDLLVRKNAVEYRWIKCTSKLSKSFYVIILSGLIMPAFWCRCKFIINIMLATGCWKFRTVTWCLLRDTVAVMTIVVRSQGRFMLQCCFKIGLVLFEPI